MGNQLVNIWFKFRNKEKVSLYATNNCYIPAAAVLLSLSYFFLKQDYWGLASLEDELTPTLQLNFNSKYKKIEISNAL